MQTPIDFGKNFLNSFFSSRDPDLCLEDMAYDVVWITPKQMYHFLFRASKFRTTCSR